MANITIKGIDSLTRKLNNIGNLHLTTAMNDALKMVHGEAKSLAPSDTGFLSDSIHMDKKKTAEGLQGRVYTNLEYAAYVEFGTGVKGNGTYPYKIEGLSLEYKDKGWCYWSDKEDKLIYTTGQKAQPYMYPALKNNKKAIEKLFKEGTKSKLRKICKGGQ